MAAAFLELYLTPFMVFVCVLTRISGLMATAPMLANQGVPVRVRAFLAVGTSLIITPLHWNALADRPANLLQLSVVMGQEFIIGLAMGLAVMILFAGLQLAGQVIGQMSGMSLADVYDPSFDASVPIFSRLIDLVALAVFLTIGGHRRLMSALLDTFASMPPGRARFTEGVVELLVDAVSQSFVMGLRAAAPVMVALLMSILIMGLISRTLPQLNIIAVGFSLNATVMLAAFSLTLGAAIWAFQDEADLAIEAINDTFARLPYSP